MCLTCTTFLCGYNDHTRHSTSTIDRSCTTIFQNLEALNIVRVQTCNSWRNQGFCITWWQIISTYVSNILLNNSINNPKRFATTIDRGGTTNTNLWSCTESTTNILHTNTGRTSFEWAANICYTTKQSIISLNLVGSTSKHTTIHLWHTRNNNFVQNLLVGFQSDLHVVLCQNTLSFHTQIAYY